MGTKQPIAAREIPRPFAAAALVGLSEDELLDRLTVEHLARAAYWKLWADAKTDNTALLRGLKHPDANVRATCCQILDHFLDDAALAEIIECLDDRDPRVRGWALHTLGCDRCKEGECRPGEQVFVPAATRMVRDDPHPRVRATAAETLGRSSARRSESVLAALAAASSEDPDPHVRRVAARFLPAAGRTRRRKKGA
jgi:HEAT repeat protein